MIFYNIYIDVYVTLCVGHFYLWGGVLGGVGGWSWSWSWWGLPLPLFELLFCVVNLFFYDKVVLSWSCRLLMFSWVSNNTKFFLHRNLNGNLCLLISCLILICLWMLIFLKREEAREMMMVQSEFFLAESAFLKEYRDKLM